MPSLPQITAVSAFFALLGCTSVVIEFNQETETSAGDDMGDGDGDGDDLGDGDGDGDSGDGDGEPIDPNKFRVVVLSDLYLTAPDYDTDDDSLLAAKMRLLAARDQINAMSPAPDFVVVLGDMVYDAYPFNNPQWFADNESAFSEVKEVLAGFDMPVYPVFGDSDYNVPDSTKQFSHALFAQFYAREPHSSIDHRGWRFVFANSQEGQTFDVITESYDPSVGSFGANQLIWLDEQLDAGLPTIVFSHFPILSLAKDEANNGPYPDFESLIEDAGSNLAMVLSGHQYEWTNIPGVYAVPHIVFGATRYDRDNFLLFEFTDSVKEYEILDLGKVNWGTSEADTWTYQGTPAPE